MKTPRELLYIIITIVLLGGCSLLSQLAGSQWLSSALDLASAGSRAYFDRHPSQERQQAIADAYLEVLRAQAAYDGDRSPEHKAAVVEAYRAYLELLTEYGIRSAQGPVGGAEGNAPLPQPLDPTGKRLPTPEELAEVL
jgi:hypothetical protein